MYYNYADLKYINQELSGIWPGWTAVKLLGRGAFGAVYEIHRNVWSNLEKAALKVLRVPENEVEVMQLRAQGVTRENTEDYYEKYVDSIHNEISIMQKLVGNSHLVSYEDYTIRKRQDDIGWDIFIRMELLTALPAFMDINPADEHTILKIGMDISQGLSVCHKKGIIHRDIKPQNIFVNDNGDFKLGDFGVARMSSETKNALSFKGTLTYMAPEVYRMVSTDARSDIYSLGMVLYQYLNENRLPFVQKNFTPDDIEISRQKRIAGEFIPDPEHGSDELKCIVRKAMAEKPEDRFQTAEEMYFALSELFTNSFRRELSAENGLHIVEADESNQVINEDKKNVSTQVDNEEKDEETVFLEFLETDDHDEKTTFSTWPEDEQDTTIFEEDDNDEEQPRHIRLGNQSSQFAHQTKNENEIDIERSERKSKENWKKGAFPITVGIILLIFIVGFISSRDMNSQVIENEVAQTHTHSWTEATCTIPKTCEVCGAQLGAALDHDWIPATYDSPEVCSRCGKRRGHEKGYVNRDQLLQGGFLDEVEEFPYYLVNPYYFNEKLVKCRKLSLAIKVFDTTGDPYGEYGVWALSDGEWVLIESWDVKKFDYGYERKIILDPAMDISAIVVMPKNNFDHDVTFCVDYDFFSAQIE